MAEKSNSQIVIIAGPNGTVRPHLHLNADTIAQGLSAFQPEQAAFEAGRIMLKRLRELAEQQKSFAFETTLATRSYAGWLERLREQGYQVHLSFLWLRSPEMAIERVKYRVASGGHNIPEETIRRRYRKGIKSFFSLYQPLADSWAVYDNSAFHNPALIANGEGKAEIVIQPALWQSFCEVAK